MVVHACRCLAIQSRTYGARTHGARTHGAHTYGAHTYGARTHGAHAHGARTHGDTHTHKHMMQRLGTGWVEHAATCDLLASAGISRGHPV